MLKRLFCKHDYKEIKGTRHIIMNGSDKGAYFKCKKCGKKIFTSIFNKKVQNSKIITNQELVQNYVNNHRDVIEIGEINDGSHTFNELYYHRMVLFSIICNTYKNKAWKSWKHEDGTMYDNYFIVGITTPNGDYSYHYEKSYWDRFKVKELENAPKWDGHKPSDIDRLYSLLEDK